jgi:predicted dehydrogenase
VGAAERDEKRPGEKMDNGKVRCGVIGAGLLGMRHAEFLAAAAKATLVAVADLRPEVLQIVAAKTGARTYAAYEEMLAREKIDLALVETPDNHHRAPAIAVCQAGVRNLVVQKPLSTTVEDGEAILAAARRSGTSIFVWYENRAFATDMATQYAIREGLIGRVIYGDCDTENSINTPLGMWGERSRDWVSGSSPACFLASHTIDRLHWYLAPAKVTRVSAIEQREVLVHTPDLYDVLLSFDTGVKARVKVGWIHRIEGKIESSEIFNGTTGSVYNNRHPRFNMLAGWRVNVGDDHVGVDDLRRHQAVLHDRGVGSRLIEGDLIATGWGRKGPLGLEIPIAEAPKHELLQFVLDGVLENTQTPESWRAWQGDQPLVDGEIALENVKVIAAIEQSAMTGLPVELAWGGR